MQDVEKLILVFRKLIAGGNYIILVEHNTDIIRAADRIIDLGPQGGDKGGKLLYSGTVSGIANCTESFTGKALNR
jgi:excinuclease ABC subunit A